MIQRKKGGESEISKVLVALIIGALVLVFLFLFLPKIGINIIEFIKNINPFSGEKDNTPAITELEPLPGVFPETFEFTRYQEEGKEHYTLVDDLRLYFITQSYKGFDRINSFYYLVLIDKRGECKEVWKSDASKKRIESNYNCEISIIERFTNEFKEKKGELSNFPEKFSYSTEIEAAGYTIEAELLPLRYYKIVYAKDGGQKEYYLGEIYDSAVPEGLWKTGSSFDIPNKEKLEKGWWGDDPNAVRFRTAFIKAQHET